MIWFLLLFLVVPIYSAGNPYGKVQDPVQNKINEDLYRRFSSLNTGLSNDWRLQMVEKWENLNLGEYVAGWKVNPLYLAGGNILIKSNGEIVTQNFVTGITGWRIQGSGDAEFNDVIVRGTIYAKIGKIGCDANFEGGWDIEYQTLTGGDVQLDSDGYIYIGKAPNRIILDGVRQEMYTEQFRDGNLGPFNGNGFLISPRRSIFNDVDVAGELSATAFVIGTIHAVNGMLYVTNCSSLAKPLTATATYFITVDNVFYKDDIVLMKNLGKMNDYNDADAWLYGTGTNTVIVDYQSTKEYMKVLSTGTGYVEYNDVDKSTYTGFHYNIQRDLNQNGANDFPLKQPVISERRVGEGFMILDANTSGASPRMNMVVRTSTSFPNGLNTGITNKLAIGRLNGIYDSLYGYLPDTYGLWCDNVYLKGKLYAPEIKTALTGNRVEITTNSIVAYNPSENKVFEVVVASTNTATIGDVIMGDYNSGKYAMWDQSASSFIVKGAYDISYSTWKTGYYVVNPSELVEAGSGGGTILNNHGSYVYDSSVNGGWAFASVNLPNEAVINSITLRYYDNDATEYADVYFRLYRSSYTTFTGELLVSTNSAGKSGFGSVIANNISYPIIENNNYCYYCRVDLGSEDEDTSFMGAIIEYYYLKPEH